MKTLRYFILLLAVVISGSIFAQKSQQELGEILKNHGEYYFSLPIQKPADIQAINQLCSVDAIEGNSVICYANVKQYDNLIKQGYQPTLMMPPSLREEVAMWDGSNRAEYDWDSYPTYSAYENMMFQFATDHPDKCEIITLGTLPSGRKILIAHINNGTSEGKPKFLYTSTIHGDETTGWIMMLRLIDYILENPTLPECQTVLDNIDLYIGPLANPDGTYHSGNNNVSGATRYNANGVDLNRNYADPHGSAHPDGNPYAQETEWFMQLAQENNFVMGANYHGGAEVMNYPWDNTYTLHADDQWWKLISLDYVSLCRQVSPNYMSDTYGNGITNGAAWYMIGGGRQDYMNGYAECREETIECSSTKCPNASQMPNFWNINKNAIFAYANHVLYGIHGVVTDSITGEPLEATITIAEHDDEFSVVESHLPVGDFHRPIKGGSYSLIISKDGYCPKVIDVTVADYETVNLDVQLVPGSCLLPYFSASTTQVALGGTVHFTDNSFGDIASWSWTFEGGSPATSTERNPNVVYTEAGSFDVSLTITDTNGNSETLTRNNYIFAAESYNMQNGTVTTCNALFYDNGGPNNSYSNNRDYTLTFLPATEGNMIGVTFTEFNTETDYDFLYIYDGNSTNSTLIGKYSGGNNPGQVVATNDEGALTFRFTSDNWTTSSGWAARVYCVSNEPLVVEVSAEPEIIDEGESTQLNVVVTGGSGEYTYVWEPAETLDNPNIANPIATPNAPTTVYKVVVSDSQGNSESGEVTVTIRDWSVEENLSKLKVYPNPNNGCFTLNATGKFTFKLFNSLGQQVLSGEGEDITVIDASGLNQGVYFLQLTSDGTQVEKLVIEK